MRPEDWLERWESGRTPFHSDTVNEALRRFATTLLPGRGRRRILVPLCGRSVDMDWLAAQGHEVVGVELSPRAVRGFFDDHALPFREEAVPPFRVFCGEAVTLWAGDFLAATPGALGTFDAVWDRAALIALPPQERRRYAERLRALMRAHARQLLVTLDYDEAEMDGPPFAVTGAEVRALYPEMEIRELSRQEGPDDEGRLADAGLSRLTRSTWLLAPRPGGTAT